MQYHAKTQYGDLVQYTLSRTGWLNISAACSMFDTTCRTAVSVQRLCQNPDCSGGRTSGDDRYYISWQTI